MARPGYGKRSAPGQLPRQRDTFSHLPEREAYLAAFIDRLPDGAAIGIKALAEAQPRYGQQAVATALRNLSVAGHLRRVHLGAGEGPGKLVTRTFFSRTARDDAWWATFLRDDGTPHRAPNGLQNQLPHQLPQRPPYWLPHRLPYWLPRPRRYRLGSPPHP
ncbi:hypothetical protein [Streptomyces sp. MST-110588]|uniref:hypothetical protein n=1 Tax=Streptomyces sp. MST-110588 TaxID=2833628 RepID=UPI001F5D8090|nr:hypothetical protein [Streptomyces sp. MST-110588]